VACFDFNGLGHSEKEILTYGICEKNDVKIVLDFLEEHQNQN